MITKPNFSTFQSMVSRPQTIILNSMTDIKDKDGSIIERSDSNDSSRRKSTLRFGESFGTAVVRTMAAKKVVAKARQILKLKTQTQVASLVSLESNENSEQDFKEFAEQFGTLVRVLNPGNDFGDASNTVLPT